MKTCDIKSALNNKYLQSVTKICMHALIVQNLLRAQMM